MYLIKNTVRLVAQCFVWPSIKLLQTVNAGHELGCSTQKNKITRHPQCLQIHLFLRPQGLDRQKCCSLRHTNETGPLQQSSHFSGVFPFRRSSHFVTSSFFRHRCQQPSYLSTMESSLHNLVITSILLYGFRIFSAYNVLCIVSTYHNSRAKPLEGGSIVSHFDKFVLCCYNFITVQMTGIHSVIGLFN